MSSSNEANAEEGTPAVPEVVPETVPGGEVPPTVDSAPVADPPPIFQGPLTEVDPLYSTDGDAAGWDEAEYEQDELWRLNETPLESYGSVDDASDFGPVVDEIHESLRRHHLVILHSTDAAHLARVSKSLVARHFLPPRRCWSVHFKQQSGISAPPAAPSIRRIVSCVDPRAEALVVVFDQHYGDDSLLLTYDYQSTRGRNLRDRLASRRNTYVLVLTLTSRFERLVHRFGGNELEPLGKVLPPEQSQTAKALPGPALLDDVRATYGLSGVLSLWCLAWFSDASADGIISCIQGMVEHKYQDDENREDVLEAWRSNWNEILAMLAATIEDTPAGVKVLLPGGSWIDELQRLFRGTHRIRHIEAMGLLRNSGVLSNAEPDFLQAFASFAARLAKLEVQIGREILVQLVEEWLPGDSRELTLYVLVSVFGSLVRNENERLASDALETLCRRGHAGTAAAILMRCPTSYVTQEWHIRLYDRVLPAMAHDDRPLLWSRFVRISVAQDASLPEAVQLAHEHLSATAFAEFIGRFVEEALLGPHNLRTRLLGFLRATGADPSSVGSRICATIQSDHFQVHARRRAHMWSSNGTGQALFDIWIVRTLVPIVPSVAPHRLLSLFGNALYDELPTRIPTQFRRATPVDEIVAMLLVESSTDTGPGTVVGEDIHLLVRALIPDREAATATYETLRTLSDRFLRASRVPAVSALRGDSVDMDAQIAIRRFFAEKSAAIRQLRTYLENTYFQGAKRVDQTSR